MKNGIWINENEFVSFKESGKKASMSLAKEFASRGRSIDFQHAFSLYLPDPDPVLRKLGKDIKVYRELLGDAHVGATVDSRKSGTKALEWQVAGANATSREAKLLTELFQGLEMERIIGEMLNAPLFGFQPIEVMWEKKGRFVLPKDLVGKPPEWFYFSPENELLFRTKNSLGGEPVPEMKFLLPRYNPSYANPYGERALARCFWPVTFKRGGLKFWVIFTEKYGMPFLLGKHPRGTSEAEVQALLDSLENMFQDAVAVVPDDSSVEIKESTSRGSSAEVYEKLLRFTNSEMSKAILGQTLTTELDNTGSFAASKTHMDVRADILNGDKRLVEQTFNTLIRWIHKINFPTSVEIPKFSLFKEEDVDKELAERDRILTDAGVMFTKSYFMRTYGLDADDLSVETDKPKAQKPKTGEDKAPSADIADNFSAQDTFDKYVNGKTREINKI